jgi:hypothetical protein
MTAIALMICRLSFTDVTDLSYHASLAVVSREPGCRITRAWLSYHVCPAGTDEFPPRDPLQGRDTRKEGRNDE